MDDAQLFVDKRIHKNDARERAEMKEGINHQLLLLTLSTVVPESIKAASMVATV
jgi:hypothetical protein